MLVNGFVSIIQKYSHQNIMCCFIVFCLMWVWINYTFGVKFFNTVIRSPKTGVCRYCFFL
jgi:uncharacterized membrane protein